MPEIEAVRGDSNRGPARNLILVVTLTAVSVLLWQSPGSTDPAAPPNLSIRGPTQLSDKSAGDIYYISTSHLYVGFRCTD